LQKLLSANEQLCNKIQILPGFQFLECSGIPLVKTDSCVWNELILGQTLTKTLSKADNYFAPMGSAEAGFHCRLYLAKISPMTLSLRFL